MNNEVKKLVDVVEGAEKVYDAATDRAVERMKQVEVNLEKDHETAKKAMEAGVETYEVVVDAVTDHICSLLKGEKKDLNELRANAIATIDRMVEKADGYYDVITDRLMERFKSDEANMEMDIETGKKLVNALKEDAKKRNEI